MVWRCFPLVIIDLNYFRAASVTRRHRLRGHLDLSTPLTTEERCDARARARALALVVSDACDAFLVPFVAFVVFVTLRPAARYR